jgi:hypothetical protein
VSDETETQRLDTVAPRSNKNLALIEHAFKSESHTTTAIFPRSIVPVRTR